MLKSMTGYGRCEETVNGRHITAELKSVNHKYFEFSPRVTRGYGFLEDKLKTYEMCIRDRTDVVREFCGALRDAAQNVQHLAVELTRVGLSLSLIHISTQTWAKVPSQALSDALVEMFQDKLKPDK